VALAELVGVTQHTVGRSWGFGSPLIGFHSAAGPGNLGFSGLLFSRVTLSWFCGCWQKSLGSQTKNSQCVSISYTSGLSSWEAYFFQESPYRGSVAAGRRHKSLGSQTKNSQCVSISYTSGLSSWEAPHPQVAPLRCGWDGNSRL
jgi:hypothetical protein